MGGGVSYNGGRQFHSLIAIVEGKKKNLQLPILVYSWL